MSEPRWHKLGPAAELQKRPLQHLRVGSVQIALSCVDGQFGAIAGACLHVGGPLGDGTLENDYVVCPWHGWMFHRCTGEARPGIPAAVARYNLKEEGGDLYVDLEPASRAKHAAHPPHPLMCPIRREPGPVRVVGISSTAMDRAPVALGLLLGVAGMVGDLSESLMKRAAAVKDIGVLFPGHGGMLDRTDSLLFAAPVLFYYHKYFMG